jgi:hypothetical protein
VGVRRVRLTLGILAALLSGCGGGRADRPTSSRAAPRTAPVASKRHDRHVHRPRPVALVTDESQDLVAVVGLRSGQARVFIGVSGAPEYVAAEWGVGLVASPETGTVTVLGDDPLRVTKCCTASPPRTSSRSRPTATTPT